MKKYALVKSPERSFLIVAMLLAFGPLNAQIPTIISFTPTSGPVGTTVTITGTNFSTTPADNIVWFGAVRAQVTEASATELKVTVPAGATYEPVTVAVNGHSGQSEKPFNVTFSVIRNINETSLATRIDFSTGLNPQDIAMTDIDGDGKADLVVTNSNGNDISVHRNISVAGILNYSSFSWKVSVHSYSTPYRVSVADMDCDGKPDLVVANAPSSGSVSIFRNNSTPGSITEGSFDPRIDLMTGNSSNDVAVSDIDLDGKPDIVVTNYNSNFISIYRNISSPGSITAGSFETRVDLPSALNLQTLVLADIDSDLKPDIVVPNYNSGTISIYRNISVPGVITAGSFDTKVDFVTGMNPYCAAVTDLDQDGKPDLAVTNTMSATVSVFRNIGTTGSINTGTFDAKIDFFTGYGPRGLTVGDINGDGKPDLIISNSGNNRISVLKNNCSPGTLTAESFISKTEFETWTSPEGSVAGDIDGDHKTDIAVVNNGSNVISIYRNLMPEPILPIITSFTPSSGYVGSVVTINGSNFSSTPSENTVKFGSVTATVTGAMINQLTVTVPLGFTSQPISVTVNELTATSASQFHIIIPVPPPQITSFAPVAGPVNTTITVSGSNFSAAPAENIVWFGAVKATVLSATTTQLTVTVPTGATYNPVSVTVNGLTGFSAIPYGITFPSIRAIDIRTFPEKYDLNTGMSPKGIAISDIDGDGKSDMVIANQTGNYITLFRNTTTTGSVSESSFSTGVEFVTSSGPDGVMVSDIDGDGKQDIIISYSSGSMVSIFRNKSVPGSISISSLDTRYDLNTISGPVPFAFAVNDIDGDGKPDLIVTNDVNSISVYKNNCPPGSISAGAFASKVDFSTITSPRGLAIGDLDGDGKPDVIVTNSSAGILSVYKNTSISGSIDAGSLATKVDFTCGADPTGIIAGDIDGDGKSDLIVANSMSNTISIFRNKSATGSINSSSFEAKVDFNTNTYPQYFSLADLNGDGKPEIIVINSTNNSVSVFRNTSEPGSITLSSFASKADFQTGSSPRGIAIGDIDGDVKPDLLVTNSVSNSISLFHNSIPESIIPPPTITSFSPSSGLVGTPVTISGSNFSPTPADNIVWFGPVKGTVTAATTTQLTVTVPAFSGYKPISVTVNGLTAYSSLPFYPAFSSLKPFSPDDLSSKIDLVNGNWQDGLAVGDIDCDGKPDLIVTTPANNNITIYRNIGASGSLTSNSYSLNVNLPAAGNPKGIALADIDGDGKPDLAVANNNGYVSVYHNRSTQGIIDVSSFATRVDYASGGGPNEVLIGEIDGDGKPDLIVSNWGSNTISIFINRSEQGSITPASFPEKYELITGLNPSGFALGDIDGDNKTDLLVAHDGINHFSIFRNTSVQGTIGPGSFAPRMDFGTITTLWGINIADIDGDNKPDVIVPNNKSTSISIFRNISNVGMIGPGSFEAKVDFTTLNNPDHIAVGDIDGDGKPDIAVTDFGSASVSLFRNTSTPGTITSGSLSARYDYTTGDNPRAVLINDLDGDNLPDMAVTNNSQNSVSLFRNLLGDIFPPTISSFSPASGQVGSTVTITGTNFSQVISENEVTFGDTRAIILSATKTQLIVTVPSGSANGPIKVKVYGLTGTSASSFTITASSPPPVITSLSHTSGNVGMTISINGLNFSTTPVNNLVWFGAVRATVLSASATQLQVTVPIGATYSKITVTVNGLTAYSSSPFIVTFPSVRTFNGYTLAPKIEIPQPAGWSHFSIISDIDVDGKPDLVILNGGSGTVSIFRNISIPGTISQGSFASKVDLNIPGGANGIAVGDIDGDGKPDIAATIQSENNVKIIRNQSVPGSLTSDSFCPAITYQTGSRPEGIAIGDLDGDGKPDLAVSNYGDGVNQSSYTLSILRNIGFPGSINSGSFAPKTDIQSNHGGMYVEINDIDQDGKPDVIVTTFTMAITIFRNTATPGTITSASFSPKIDIGSANALTSSFIADVDGDGKPDIVFANKESSSVSILKNISTPGVITRNSFDPIVNIPIGSKPIDVKLGDIDGDGKPDIVAISEDNSYLSLIRNISVAGSINSGSFAPEVEFNTVYGNGNIVIGDLDSDTKPDIVIKHWYENHLSILRNNIPTPNLPVINSLSPTSGPVGTTLTINGSNFSPVAENNIVMFGNVQGIVTASSNNQISVTVPAGADGQPITVIVYGYYINSGFAFKETIPNDIEIESSIITLNGDGKNDRFKIKFFEIYGQSSFYVYNARGALIFWNENFNGEWDLTIKERLLETGGYFFVIKTELGEYRGSFSILKE